MNTKVVDTLSKKKSCQVLIVYKHENCNDTYTCIFKLILCIDKYCLVSVNAVVLLAVKHDYISICWLPRLQHHVLAVPGFVIFPFVTISFLGIATIQFSVFGLTLKIPVKDVQILRMALCRPNAFLAFVVTQSIFLLPLITYPLCYAKSGTYGRSCANTANY